MLRPYIYLAGPIECRSAREAHEWREHAQKLLEPRLCAVSPLRGEVNPAYGGVFEPATRAHDPHFGSAAAIRHKNMLDVSRADGMLVYLPDMWVADRAPIGTLLEIGWTQFRIPIVLVTDSPRFGNHPVLADGVGWIVSPTPENLKRVTDAAKILHALFDVYSEESHEHGLFLQRGNGYTPVTDTTAPRSTALYRTDRADTQRVTFEGAEGTDHFDPDPGAESVSKPVAPDAPVRKRRNAKRGRG